MRSALTLALATTLACININATARTTMEDMIDAIADDARRTASYTGIAKFDDRVMAAMASVRREEFVPAKAKEIAYVNRPLPIGHSQTISQPFIVALMTDLMRTRPGDTVLEIGTGSGYQAAILAELVERVYTIEIVPELAVSAGKRLARLGYDNVHVKTGDGWYGWPDAAPFDAIIVTAVGEDVPDKLVEQLKPGARLVLPVGSAWEQNLAVVEKDDDGEISIRHVLPVRFVPLTGDH